ncbi:unnamed protein product [Cylicostephanus goldi]|uniref:SCP domain-containing protein n=1 Tax=Cylicostephanus goldi TaxID=71465 RepID=A0A3P7LSV6_CYLGO|nr:unnamed protein product [Cylicostephanus goldi]
MFLLLILPLTAVIVPSAFPQALCADKGGKVEESSTNEILKIINNRRKNLAKGLVKDQANAALPKAKLMNKLAWDCDLEVAAKAKLSCPAKGSTPTEPKPDAGNTGYFFEFLIRSSCSIVIGNKRALPESLIVPSDSNNLKLKTMVTTQHPSLSTDAGKDGYPASVVVSKWIEEIVGMHFGMHFIQARNFSDADQDGYPMSVVVSKWIDEIKAKAYTGTKGTTEVKAPNPVGTDFKNFANVSLNTAKICHIVNKVKANFPAHAV